MNSGNLQGKTIVLSFDWYGNKNFVSSAFMESTLLLSSAAVIGFAVYYEMVDVTYLDHINASTNFSQGWINIDGGYEDWQLVTGFNVGIVSAFICLYVLINVGVCKQFFFRIREKCGTNNFLREILPPTIGGLVIGTCFLLILFV